MSEIGSGRGCFVVELRRKGQNVGKFGAARRTDWTVDNKRLGKEGGRYDCVILNEAMSCCDVQLYLEVAVLSHDITSWKERQTECVGIQSRGKMLLPG